MSTQVRLRNKSPCPWPPTRWPTAWTWTSLWSLGTWRSEAGSLSAQMTTGKSIGLPLRHAGQQDTWYSPGGKIYLETVVTQESFFCRLRLPNERLPNHQPLLQPLWAHAQGHHGEKHQKVQKGLAQSSRREKIEINPKYQKGIEEIWSGRGTPWPRRVGKVEKKLSRNKKLFMGRHPAQWYRCQLEVA